MKPFSLDDIRDQFGADLEGFIAVTRLNLEYYLSPGGSASDIEMAKLQVRTMRFVASLVQAWGLAWLGEDLEIMYDIARSCHDSDPQMAQEVVVQISCCIPEWQQVGKLILAGDELEAIATYRSIRSRFEPLWSSYLPTRRVPVKSKHAPTLKMSVREIIETATVLLDKVPSLALVKISEKLPALQTPVAAVHLKGFEPGRLAQQEAPSFDKISSIEEESGVPSGPSEVADSYLPSSPEQKETGGDGIAPPHEIKPAPQPAQEEGPKRKKELTSTQVFDEGYIALKQGALELAQEKFRLALSMDPENRILQYNLRVVEKKIAASSGVAK